MLLLCTLSSLQKRLRLEEPIDIIEGCNQALKAFDAVAKHILYVQQLLIECQHALLENKTTVPAWVVYDLGSFGSSPVLVLIASFLEKAKNFHILVSKRVICILATQAKDRFLKKFSEVSLTTVIFVESFL